MFALGAVDRASHWTPATRSILAFAACGGVALFSGLLVLQATLAFWTVESLEVANVLTYGGEAAAQYPMNVYAGLVPRLPDLRRADRLRHLFADAGGDGPGRPAGRAGLGACRWRRLAGFAFLGVASGPGVSASATTPRPEARAVGSTESG